MRTGLRKEKVVEAVAFVEQAISSHSAQVVESLTFLSGFGTLFSISHSHIVTCGLFAPDVLLSEFGFDLKNRSIEVSISSGDLFTAS